MICKIIKTQQQHKPMLKAHILTGVQYFPRSKFLNTFGEYQTKLFSDTPKKKKKRQKQTKNLIEEFGLNSAVLLSDRRLLLANL